MMTNLSNFHRSRLPHVTPLGATFFVTFRVKDALPLRLMQGLRFEYEQSVALLSKSSLPCLQKRQELAKTRYKYFCTYDERLDGCSDDHCYFRDPRACEIMAEHIHKHDGDLYELKAYSIMPNHVHLLVNLGNQLADEQNFMLPEEELQLTYTPLSEIMRRLKGAASRSINQCLGRSGTLWQKDSYDHYVRNHRAYNNVLYYILHNSLKAGLVTDWKEYPFHYHT